MAHIWAALICFKGVFTEKPVGFPVREILTFEHTILLFVQILQTVKKPSNYTMQT